MRKLLISLFSVFIFIFLFLNICYCSADTFIWSEDSSVVYTSALPNNTSNLNLECASAVLIEQNSGKILYEHNCHEQLKPASVTKVMSILLIMEALDSGKINLEDKVPCSQNAANMGGSQIWLDTREELTVNEMLKAICVASANDCTVAMAEYLTGSEEAFVEKMNIRAKELGMNDTCFKNCHGLDTDGHVTSSYDIALMSRELLKNHPNITNYTTIWTDTLRDGKSELTNTNKLIRNYKGATGLKTGSTSLALYNLSASATRDDLSLIAVVMKAPTTQIRFSDAEKLLNYGFNNFSYSKLATKNTVLKSVNVTKGVDSCVNVVYSDDCGALIEKNSNNSIEQIINIPDNIQAPIYKGQEIGDISYVLNCENIASVSIIADEDVPKISLSTMMEKIFFQWFRLLR